MQVDSIHGNNIKIIVRQGRTVGGAMGSVAPLPPALEKVRVLGVKCVFLASTSYILPDMMQKIFAPPVRQRERSILSAKGPREKRAA